MVCPLPPPFVPPSLTRISFPLPGLRLYWQSPWATYSRGRSRWRNQYLVDHLKKSGVERTKKQVASHIQVLRNMWRGQPGTSCQPLDRHVSSLAHSPRIPSRRGRRRALPGEWSSGSHQPEAPRISDNRVRESSSPCQLDHRFITVVHPRISSLRVRLRRPVRIVLPAPLSALPQYSIRRHPPRGCLRKYGFSDDIDGP